jgi:hypothetical protein
MINNKNKGDGIKTYALKFREKGSKEYKTVLIMTADDAELNNKFEVFALKGDYNIDHRTVSWAGNSIPFLTKDKPTVVYVDLDEVN